jgi:hypothetical protein
MYQNNSNLGNQEDNPCNLKVNPIVKIYQKIHVRKGMYNEIMATIIEKASL